MLVVSNDPNYETDNRERGTLGEFNESNDFIYKKRNKGKVLAPPLDLCHALGEFNTPNERKQK